MCELRAQKVANVAADIPEQYVEGNESGDLLVLSWGGTYGACLTAVREAQATGLAVSHAHLRYLNPFPRNLGDLLGRFKKVLVPELNLGQLRALIRSEFLVDALGLNKVKGKPFAVSEVLARIRKELAQ
jgi:2-oxoglutarate ferredoxin oxidoreductase subunit alpha